jgi:hypothetical protein
MSKQLRTFISVFLLLAGCILLLWGCLPVYYESELEELANERLRVGEGSETVIPGSLQVVLTWPRSLRIGKGEEIRLEVVSVQHAGQPAQEIGLEDAYQFYNVMAEARFEVAGVRLEPANAVRQSMLPNQPLHFTWEIFPDKAGWNDGTAWLSLRFLPLDGSTPVQVPVYSDEMSLHATSLLGLSAPVARGMGSAVIFISLGIAIHDRIWGRRGSANIKPEMGKKNTTDKR